MLRSTIGPCASSGWLLHTLYPLTLEATLPMPPPALPVLPTSLAPLPAPLPPPQAATGSASMDIEASMISPRTLVLQLFATPFPDLKLMIARIRRSRWVCTKPAFLHRRSLPFLYHFRVLHSFDQMV